MGGLTHGVYTGFSVQEIKWFSMPGRELHLEMLCSASRAILSLFASAQKNLEYRSNLHKKTIVDSLNCEVCGSGDEMAGHIIVVGPFDV